MKRHHISELQPPAKLKESPAQRQFLPTKREELKKFILDASDEKMQNADFQVKHLFIMIQGGTVAAIEKILKFHPELVNQYGSLGSRPLMVVLRNTRSKTGFSLNLVEMLLNYGANPLLRDIQQKENDIPLTPVELVTQMMQDPNLVRIKMENCRRCKKLFDIYVKKDELKTYQENISNVNQTFDLHSILEMEGLDDLELTQHLEDLSNEENLLDESELVFPEPLTEVVLPQLPVIRLFPPHKVIELKEFITLANDEKMQNAYFEVRHLLTMINSGTIPAIKKILKFHPEIVNQHGARGRTPLMAALRQNRSNGCFNSNVVKTLLQYGANPLLRDQRHGKDDVLLTPMELIKQFMQSVNCVGLALKKCQECMELFEVYEKNCESQAMLKIQDARGSELTQHLQDLLNQPELVQFREQDLETDLFTVFPSLISCNSKTTQNKKELAVSTDFLEPVKGRSDFNLGST